MFSSAWCVRIALLKANGEVHLRQMPDRSTKYPANPSKLAKLGLNAATGASDPAPKEKDPAAVALGRKGGLKGGKARAESLTPEKRSEIARKAANARYSKE